jgi:hypothetical protein
VTCPVLEQARAHAPQVIRIVAPGRHRHGTSTSRTTRNTVPAASPEAKM